MHMEQGQVEAGAKDRTSKIQRVYRGGGRAGRQRMREPPALGKINTHSLPGGRMLRPQRLYQMSKRWGWLEVWAPLGSVPKEEDKVGLGFFLRCVLGVSTDLGDNFAPAFP